MSILTAEQLSRLGDGFSKVANELLDYRMGHVLATDDDIKLENLQNALIDKATKLYAFSAIQVGQEVTDSVDRLNEITNNINITLKSLSSVQKIIDIAVASLKVVTSIITMNAGDIVASVANLALISDTQQDS